MVDVTTKIIINCPINKLSEFTSNPDNAPKWYKNIKSVEWKTSKLLKVGSKIAFKARFLGRELAYVYEIAEYIPEKKLIMRTSEGPFLMETTYVYEPVNDNTTKMILRNRGTPKGFSKLFSQFMTFVMKRANRKDLLMLKKVMGNSTSNIAANH